MQGQARVCRQCKRSENTCALLPARIVATARLTHFTSPGAVAAPPHNSLLKRAQGAPGTNTQPHRKVAHELAAVDMRQRAAASCCRSVLARQLVLVLRRLDRACAAEKRGREGTGAMSEMCSSVWTAPRSGLSGACCCCAAAHRQNDDTNNHDNVNTNLHSAMLALCEIRRLGQHGPSREPGAVERLHAHAVQT